MAKNKPNQQVEVVTMYDKNGDVTMVANDVVFFKKSGLYTLGQIKASPFLSTAFNDSDLKWQAGVDWGREKPEPKHKILERWLKSTKG